MPQRAPHVVLVGKGITFDTGGLSIKPAEAMVNMKRDMTGGAVVVATMAALAAVDCPVRVTGLVAAAENAVGGDAMRPGDVIRHYGGRTTEVTNTDAEGRLVLADALAYAVDELDPAVIVDVATLTGAMKVALGQQTGGFFANDDGLAARLDAAGARRPASRCGGSRWSTTTRSKLVLRRSPTPTTGRAARARSSRRCSCSTSSASVPVGPPRHRLGRRRAEGPRRVDRRADRLRRPGPARLARLARTPWRESR